MARIGKHQPGKSGSWGPPEGEGNASKAERDLFKRIREHQQQREGERRPFRRSAADEKEGHRLAAQGLEGCKG